MSIVPADPAVVHAAPDDTPPPVEGTPAAAAAEPWSESERAEWLDAEMADASRENGGGW